MQFTKHTTAVVGLALVTLALVGFAAIGAGATTEMENDTFTFDNDSNVTVEVDWNDSIDDPDNATADVTIYEEGAYQIDGDDWTDNMASTTLNGTVAEFDNVTAGASYDVELNASATTVTVSASDIADDGTVDLSGHTDATLTSDDEILSVTASAETVVMDSIGAVEGNTIEMEYTTDDGLEDGAEYRVLVEADDTEADEVIVSDGTVGGIFTGLSDGSPGFGAGVALVAIAAAAMLARRGS